MNLVPNLKSLTFDMTCFEYEEDDDIIDWSELDCNNALTMKLIELATAPELTKLSLFKSLTSVSMTCIPRVDETYYSPASMADKTAMALQNTHILRGVLYPHLSSVMTEKDCAAHQRGPTKSG